MTAVLLTILKIIGIVLLVILGIILFLLAVLLFVPVRYSVKGTVDNNITAEGKISWLCSIFRYDFTFQEQELNGEVRIFGFRPKKKERVSEEELEEEAVPEVKDGVEEVVSDLVSAAGEEDKSEKTPIKPEQDQEVDSHKGKQNRKSSDKNSRPSGKNIFMRMWDKIKSFMKKIGKQQTAALHHRYRPLTPVFFHWHTKEADQFQRVRGKSQRDCGGHEKSVCCEAIVGRIIVSAQTFWLSENSYRTDVCVG